MVTISVKNPMEMLIREKLTDQFSPVHLEILNESYMHNVPKGSETHFKVVVVSNKFENTPLLQRHRLVNQVLSEELKNGVHALSIVAKTPSQWEDSSKITEKSPACKGGFGR
uniref:EOG090X0K4K n=1 Tax=Daphnia longispina TaxID=42846 RepID=A0A4Y7M8G2_9CRUS|nr:EOG090X0K4K [Daphnia longispina]